MIARQEAAEPEITLSTASLLGLFVGLVLVCGVFFGFGYSVGRRAATIAATGTPSATDTAENVRAAAPRLPKPSGAQIQEDRGDTSFSAPAQAASPTRTVTMPSRRSPGRIAPPPKQAAKVNEPPIEAGQTMVQVAAVLHQEDADVLVSALRKHGYHVLVRTEPQDKLWHVQVGPFAGRVQANAMKQQLASDGYNAIIKQ